MNTEPVLCYIKEPWAYFTTQKLEDQWGDDWDDAPYEHNAGEPYEPCWHNHPDVRFKPHKGRGYKPGTEIPLDVGELCRCDSCKRDWNEDGTPKWEIVKLAYDCPIDIPKEYGRYSVEQINAGVAAWLTRYSYTDGKIVTIPAGTSWSKFIELIGKCGGSVFIKNTIFTAR